MSRDDFLIGVSGGINGVPEDPSDPDFDLHGDLKLPVVPFRGLERDVVVVDSIADLPSEVSVVGFLRDTLRAFVAPHAKGGLPVAAKAVTASTFFRLHPHPKPYPNAGCGERVRSGDYFSGAKVCGHCRDRLAIVETLLASPALRAVPLRVR